MDDALLQQALALPPNERLIFAELLLASIEKENSETRQIWIDEVKARMRAVEKGEAKLLDFAELYED